VAALVVSAPATAEQPEEAIRFNYDAPAECPNLVAFTARVRERTARGRLAEPGELARTFTLVLRSDTDGYAGSIEFLDETGQPVQRKLHGEQCDSVVSGLALITALSLDSSLRVDEPRDESGAAVAEPAAEVPPSESPQPAAVAAPRKSPPAPAVPRSLSRARLGVAAGYDSATAAPRFGLLGELDWRSGLGLRLTAHYGTSQVVVDRDHQVDLRLLGLETALCAFRARLGALWLVPCANLDVGTLRAAGVASDVVTKPSNRTIAWAAAGAEARVAYEPEAPWWVELRGGLQVPLRASHRFDFEKPTVTGYRVPYYQASGAIALGWCFW
jgi:hypothetical protein